MNLEKIEAILQYSKNLRVLYVEDNYDAKVQTFEVLKDFFDHVDTADDGVQGLEMTRQHSYDLIITDINMPRMNGIDFISKIRENNDDTAILILSAYNESSYFIQTIKLGIDGYLLKPLDINQFLDTVSKTVKQIKILKENQQYKQSLEELVNQKTKELEFLYFHNPLTQLPNRMHLEHTIKTEKKRNIILIDVNNFGAINNLYGSKTGDIVLKNIAEQLVTMSHPDYNVYHFGGDQFVYLSHKNNPLTFCQSNAQTIVETLAQNPIKVIIDEHELEIYISVTIAIVHDNVDLRLLEYASMALEYAKKTHQDIVVYTPAMSLEKHYEKDLNAVKMVKKALEENRLIPFFQPIIKTDGHHTYECLARIISEEGKVISPFFFIDGVKKTKYYTELTKVMIQKAFQIFEGSRTSFSINLSYEDISNESIMDFLKQLLLEKNMAKNVILEIVESESIDNFELIKNFISEMKALGVRIALDDFGSGYSNFSYLMELKPDYIKIDGSLIKDINTNPNSYIIVKTIANFSKELNIEVIAEYIHSKEVYEKVQELNIIGFQGYFLGEPVQNITKD